MHDSEPTLSRVLFAALGAVAVGLGVVSFGVGFSAARPR
jgi:hypothetical protein